MDDFKSLLADKVRLAMALDSSLPSVKQKSDLCVLYASKGGIIVSRDGGNRVRGPTVFSCSRIGANLTRYFEGNGPKDKMMWIGYIKQDGDVEKWMMRPEIRSALKSLEWC